MNLKKNNKNFITTVTPLRISLFGGGTDLQNFINKNGYGKVINFAIDKYIYSFAKIHSDIFEKKYRLNYHETENTNEVNDIKNNIVRNSLKFYKFKDPFYVATISDVPSGTGLGSSGAFQVSMCNILNSILKKKTHPLLLAMQATHVEMNLSKSNAGFQDQFATAFGGFNEFVFSKNSKPVIKKLQKKNQNNFINQLIKNSLLIYSNKTRKAQDILKQQSQNLSKKFFFDSTREILKIEEDFSNILNSTKSNIFKEYHLLMNESWIIKKKLSNLISNDYINNIFYYLKKNGMISGKLLGAGGGGFILCTFENIKKKNSFMVKNFNKFKYLSFDLSKKGSVLIN
jgi:D-glycero-alpha-D-manno-heptose-7-phosphate kinase